MFYGCHKEECSSVRMYLGPLTLPYLEWLWGPGTQPVPYIDPRFSYIPSAREAEFEERNRRLEPFLYWQARRQYEFWRPIVTQYSRGHLKDLVGQRALEAQLLNEMDGDPPDGEEEASEDVYGGVVHAGTYRSQAWT